MGFSVESSVSVLTIFLQGLLSFFSPCVLPLLPIYITYLSGGGRTVDADGNTHYKRSKVLLNTVFFVVGISFAFFLLGFGFTAAGQFFRENRLLLGRIGGVLVILFGLYQLGVFGSVKFLNREARLPFRLDKVAMNPLTALVLGFTFSFSWTPCVGPALASVLLMASSAAAAEGFLLIAVYTVGFVLPFLVVGLFTSTLLELFRKYQGVVKYTVKISGVLMVFMGVMMFTGWMNSFTSYLSSFGAAEATGTTSSVSSTLESSTLEEDSSSAPIQEESSSREESHSSSQTESSESEAAPVPAPDFTLTDQYGNTHTLSDYQGKTVFLNFWGTWCPPCRAEMPDIQELYQELGENKEDVIILGVALPNVGNEGSKEEIISFLEENGYTYPTVMDEGGTLANSYYISGFPTTFMIDKEGNVFGYATGQLTKDIMESIIQQTIDGKRAQ
ncbi:MAG: cytochrome c biogenesis protein CcdA [Acutalibacter sp.]